MIRAVTNTIYGSGEKDVLERQVVNISFQIYEVDYVTGVNGASEKATARSSEVSLRNSLQVFGCLISD